MERLSFVRTNIGVVALRRFEHAEFLYYTQIWLRTGESDWRKYHYFTRCGDRDFSPALLETLFQHMEAQSLPYEDWW